MFVSYDRAMPVRSMRSAQENSGKPRPSARLQSRGSIGGSGLGIIIEVRDGIVHVSFPLDNDEGLSASRKTRIVASTHGNQQIGDTGVYLGLNAYRPVERAKR